MAPTCHCSSRSSCCSPEPRSSLRSIESGARTRSSRRSSASRALSPRRRPPASPVSAMTSSGAQSAETARRSFSACSLRRRRQRRWGSASVRSRHAPSRCSLSRARAPSSSSRAAILVSSRSASRSWCCLSRFSESRGRLITLGAAGLVVVGAIDLALATGSSSLSALDVVATPLGSAGLALLLAGLVMIAGVVSPRSHAPVDTGTSDAYVAVVVRIAGLGALMRVGAALASSAVIDWRASIAVIAAVSVIVASLVALGQTSPRRILAYASIAQAGYAAVALTAGFASGPTAAFFLAAFALMTVGALALIARLPSAARLGDLRGVARRRPLFVLALGTLLLALAGLPPSIGFVAKLYVPELAAGAQLAWLALLAALASVLSAGPSLPLPFACVRGGHGVRPRGPRSAP